MNLQRLIWSAALAGAMALALAGCAPLVVGAVAGTVMVASDRRTSGIQLEDEGIEFRALARVREAMAERVHVNVNSYNRHALITGEVPTEADKERVEKIVSSVDNVKRVSNELAVQSNTTIGQRSTDAFITTRVKAAYIDATDLVAQSIMVTTERNTVYLMGRVTQREAERATQLARTVPNVARVVRILDFITEEELARMLPQKPAEKKEPGTSTLR